ncbi:MAG TPA: glycerophosphodiester phosphodiesterase family protein, partial [Vicinamibacteria bacterium]|nr:glycerophosphodiester phosphodiesterase family protein [Vicinamibacteria bacterium]
MARGRGRWLGVGLSVALLGLAGAAEAPRVAAHRGGAQLWPENSLLAFRNALALGVDLVEADVHLSADGEVIVLHDPTLDRTTTGRGAVGDLRLADLAAVRLRSAGGLPTDEPVPTLAALLDLLRPSPAGLLLEIKVGRGRARYPGIEEKVLALVRGRGLTARVRLMAFEEDTLRRLRELDPAAATVLLVGRGQMRRAGATPAGSVAWATAVGARALGIDHRLLDG